MLKHIFNQTALNVLLAGNVGNSLCRELSLNNNYDIIVLEVSSFQLENINKFQPYISVILNISDDHLDRYSNFNEYRMSKFKITKNQKKEDYLIYNYDDKSLKDLKTKANKIPFSLKREFENGVFLKNKININLKNKKMTIDQLLSLNGKHNIYNSMAAAISARVFEISDSLIRKSLQDFQNVEHRLESVLKVNNIEFINDSKATNVHATWYALESMNRTIVWIAGGVDKGNNYDELFDLVKNKVKAIIVLGDDKKINKSFKSAVEKIINVGSMKEAVNLSYDLSSDGDCVLLSPACASFNMFKSFEDRGSKFKEAVRPIMSNINLQGDKTIWGVVFSLFTLSVLVVYSTAGISYLFNHISKIFLGLICMYFIHNLKFKYFARIGYFYFGLVSSCFFVFFLV